MWPYCLLPLRTSYFLSRWKPGDLSHLPITITYHACIQTHIFCPPSCYAQKWVLLLPGPSPPLGAASSLLSFTQGFCFISLFLQHWQFPHLCRIILIYITVCFISHLSCWPISLPSLIAKLFKRVIMCFISHTTLLFSHSVVSDCLWSHGLWHTRLPSPLPTPRVSSNSCPLSQWCHSTISFSVTPFSSGPQSFPASGFFQWVGSSHWWNFNINPSNEYSGLISFRIDLSPCCPSDSQESSPTPKFESISSSVLNLLYSPNLTSTHD